jgi:ribosomal protein S18 acetylase RimI-like enzyme
MQPVIPIVQLRDATLDDAPFIARVVLAGIDMLDIDAVLPDEQRAIFEHLIEICRMDDTLYSYRNTRIAETDGIPVGALVAYDGARYAGMREKTFGLVKQTSGMDLSRNAMETGPGEFYLDSMTVLSGYRGVGIGKLLVRDRMEFAFNNGFQKVTLLVDKDKPRLQEYYQSEGFSFSKEMFVFGACYNKLEKF